MRWYNQSNKGVGSWCYNRIVLFHLAVLCQIIANCGLGTAAIKNVSLLVDPTPVKKGEHATLRCIYDLDSPLYSVKFYRGLREFYRYSPAEVPNIKTFPFPGITVEVGLSNATQVVLKNVLFALSGNFSCEVTGDAPTFSTKTAHIHMQVVALPDGPPIITTDKDRYEAGETIRANCTSPPSRPKAIMTITLNNNVIIPTKTFEIPDVNNSSLLGLHETIIHQIQSHDFFGPSVIQSQRGVLGGGGGGGGSMYQNGVMMGEIGGNGLALRCTVQIGNFYQKTHEIELSQSPRDPIPARVTSSSAASNRIGHNEKTQIFSTIAIVLVGLITTTSLFHKQLHHHHLRQHQQLYLFTNR